MSLGHTLEGAQKVMCEPPHIREIRKVCRSEPMEIAIARLAPAAAKGTTVRLAGRPRAARRQRNPSPVDKSPGRQALAGFAAASPLL